MQPSLSSHAETPQKKRFSLASLFTHKQSEPQHQQSLPVPQTSHIKISDKLSLTLQHPLSHTDKKRAKKARANQQTHSISPSQLLSNPSLLTQQHPLPSSSKPFMSSTDGRAPSIAASSIQSHDTYSLITRFLKMSDAAGKGKIPSNRQVLRFLNGMEEWSNDVENVDSDDDGEDAGDGWKWSRESLDVGKAWLQSLKLVREFLQNKNEGELLQNMMENIRVGVEKDRGGFDDEDEDREERVGSGYGNGVNGKDDEVVPAIIEVIKLLAQGLVNPGSLGQMVAVLKVISDTFVGVSENGGNDADEAKPARYEEASSLSSAAEHIAEDQQKAKGPPSLPQKASADEITPAASGSESSAAQVSSATDACPPSKKPTRQLDAIAQKHLTALMRDMTAQVLPPGLFPATSVTPSPASTTTPKPQLSRLAKVLNPRAAESTESQSADDANPEEWTEPSQQTPPLIPVVEALWEENDVESNAVRVQVLRLLESMRALSAILLDGFEQFDERPGTGNYLIALELATKLAQRFSKTSIPRIMSSLSGLVTLFRAKILKVHRTTIKSTLDYLITLFEDPLASRSEQDLAKVITPFRAMIDDFSNTQIPSNGDFFEENVSMADEAAVVMEKIQDVWDALGDGDEWVYAVRENAKEWFNALFIDSDVSFVIKDAFSRDFTKGILPSLLADFKTIIIRDLTYEENNVKYEMEDLEIDLSSMLPHLCRVNIENGVLFGFNDMIKMETTNKVSVEFYQIHMNIMNVPFKMRRGNKHVEQGNMSVKIDKHGITVLIELDWAAPARDTVYKLVDVKTVKVTVQNLSVKITGTKHDGIYAAFGNKVLAKRISDEIKRGSEMEIRKAIEKWNEVLPKFVTRVGEGWNSKVDGARGLGA